MDLELTPKRETELLKSNEKGSEHRQTPTVVFLRSVTVLALSSGPYRVGTVEEKAKKDERTRRNRPETTGRVRQRCLKVLGRFTTDRESRASSQRASRAENTVEEASEEGNDGRGRE